MTEDEKAEILKQDALDRAHVVSLADGLEEAVLRGKMANDIRGVVGDFVMNDFGWIVAALRRTYGRPAADPATTRGDARS